MSNDEGSSLTFSEWAAKRVREVRKARGWSVKELAARCQEIGAPELTEGALYVLEGPRPRKVTGEEWLVLALALGVSPLVLLLPEDGDADYQITPELVVPARNVFLWSVGRPTPAVDVPPLGSEQWQRYSANMPEWLATAISEWVVTQSQPVIELEARRVFNEIDTRETKQLRAKVREIIEEWGIKVQENTAGTFVVPVPANGGEPADQTGQVGD